MILHFLCYVFGPSEEAPKEWFYGAVVGSSGQVLWKILVQKSMIAQMKSIIELIKEQ